MRSRFSLLRAVLMLLVFVLSIFVISSISNAAQPVEDAPDAIDGYPIWDETVLSILGAPGQQKNSDHLGVPEFHLGWDLETNEPLDDPAVRIGSDGKPDFQKMSEVSTEYLVYRSGYRQEAPKGLDSDFLALVASNDARGAATYGIIQFPLPFDTDARVELEKAGVKFYNYVEGGGLYARINGEAIATMEALAAEERVLYAGEIPLEGKIDPVIARRAEADASEILPITLQLFDVPDDGQLQALGTLVDVRATSLHPTLPLIDGSIPAGDAYTLANLPYVRWIELVVPNRPHNLESTMALGTDVLRSNNAGSDGTNINVAVLDTGIAQPYHTDLPAGRVIDQWEYYPGDDAVAEDDFGHGTHVAGTIGGGDADRLQGHAPDVDFLIYKLCCDIDDLGFPTADFQDALTRAGNNNAHIANNSWGGGNGTYSISSEIADRAVRGEYGDQFINMVISSGNDDDLTSYPGTAKNAITVGAVKDGNWPDTTFNNWTACSDTNWRPGQRVCFSNYGYIDADGDSWGRVKPDVMAPGVRIRSTIPGDIYADFDGTSMAAPAVTGALAAFLDHHHASASWILDWPEVVKAVTLLNAIDVGGDTALYGRGMVSVYDMAYYIPGIVNGPDVWASIMAGTGTAHQWKFDVPSGYDHVKVVLTWSDPAGAAEVANDLDLRIYSDSDCTNRVGASTEFDETVEFARVESGEPSGTWCAEAYAYSISEWGQKFAIAAKTVMEPASLSMDSSVSNSTVWPDQNFYHYTTVSNSGETAGGSYIRVTEPAGFTVLGARVYTGDGRSHYYEIDETFDVADGYHRIATGLVNGSGPRLVRWFVHTNSATPPGIYEFDSKPYYFSAGTASSGTTAVTSVTVPEPVVNETSDTDDGNCNIDCSLREAINAANLYDGSDTITFDIPDAESGCSAYNVCTITLTSPLPSIEDISGVTTIDGTGADITIDGDNAHRVFHVSPYGALDLSTLTITNGRVADSAGAAVMNEGSMTVDRCTFSGNSRTGSLSSGGGGAIFSNNDLLVTNSTFYDNDSTEPGGAVMAGGTLEIINSTFSSNHTDGQGGAVYTDAATGLIKNSTLSGNSAGFFGSAVTDAGATGSLTVANSILSVARHFRNCTVLEGGTIIDGGGNISNDATCGFRGDNTDPMHAPLADNGGSTRTHALYTGSPAIDAGVAPGCPTYDQRGVARGQIAGCDSGAYEYKSSAVTLYLGVLNGWDFVSLNLQPSNPDMAAVLAPIASNLVLVKNSAGEVYWPAYGIDQIGTWQMRESYMINSNSPGFLIVPVNGHEAIPSLTPIALDAGWNAPAYVHDSAMAVETAVAGISSELYLVKNEAGEVYWPAMGINDIGDMEVGDGYQIYMNSPAVLTYPD